MRILVCILTLFSSVYLHAQSMEQFMEWAEESSRNGDHRAAAEYYEEVLKRQPGIMSTQWMLAESYRKSNQCKEAAELYGRIVRKDLRKVHDDARRYQAEMEQCALLPDRARETWEKVVKEEKKQYGFRALKGKQALIGIAMMDSMRNAPMDVSIDRLDVPVNSCYSEMAPRMGVDSMLYFTTSNPEVLGVEQKQLSVGLARVKWLGDSWDIPTALPGTVNSGMSGNTAITSEGHLLFSMLDEEGKSGIYLSRNVGGMLQEPETLKALNKKGNNTKPMVADLNGQETLFFTSDRRGGSGGWDIWMAPITDGKVGMMRPVGAPVNTPGDETCPFYDPKNRKLYFSSNFHPGMGGYDMFSSYALAEGFSEASNWGYPFNTERDELYPAFYPDLKLGFFSRIPFEDNCCIDQNCCPDIFSFRFNRDTVPEDSTMLAVLSGSSEAVESKLQGLLPIRLYFHNDEPNPRTTRTSTQFTYKQTYDRYRELIPRYEKEQGADDGRVAAINDFFEQEAEFNFQKLNQYLGLLRVILEKGDTVELTIRGFASPLAESDYNVNLSLRRISSLINYINVFDNGSLRPFVNGTAPSGQLIISKAPYGESTSDTEVSDELSDLKNSVYSRGAAMERRIEVEAIDLFSAETQTDTVVYVEDIGKVLQNMPQDVVFMVENPGEIPLNITNAQADCGCTNAQLPEGSLLPGESTAVTVKFSGKAKEGPFERSVVIDTDGEPKVVKLTIKGIILPLQ